MSTTSTDNSTRMNDGPASTILLAHPRITTGEADRIRSLWLEQRNPEEPLAGFLARHKVLSSAAAAAVGLLRDGLAGVSATVLRLNGGFWPLASLPDNAFGTPAGSGDGSGAVPPELRINHRILPGVVFADGLFEFSELERLTGRATARIGDSSRGPGVRVADTVPTGATANRLPADEDAVVGTMVGQYRILRRLGASARGVVYEGEDELLTRRVAIKMLYPELLSQGDAAVRRFVLEARAASKLEHPNCVGVYTVGKHEGTVYFSMPLVRGRSAQETIDKNGAFTPAEATRIAAHAARGLAAAHALGIVHRDIKPANIMLGENGEVRVADFGMAKATDESIGSLTEPGRWLGTPHYMSPEQCQVLEIDGRADVYSLGCTYYALLTGRPPFADFKPLAVVYKQVGDRHPDPREVVASIPEACVRLIDRAMEKEPADHSAGPGSDPGPDRRAERRRRDGRRLPVARSHQEVLFLGSLQRIPRRPAAARHRTDSPAGRRSEGHGSPGSAPQVGTPRRLRGRVHRDARRRGKADPQSSGQCAAQDGGCRADAPVPHAQRRGQLRRAGADWKSPASGRGPDGGIAERRRAPAHAEPVPTAAPGQRRHQAEPAPGRRRLRRDVSGPAGARHRLPAIRHVAHRKRAGGLARRRGLGGLAVPVGIRPADAHNRPRAGRVRPVGALDRRAPDHPRRRRTPRLADEPRRRAGGWSGAHSSPGRGPAGAATGLGRRPPAAAGDDRRLPRTLRVLARPADRATRRRAAEAPVSRGFEPRPRADGRGTDRPTA